MDKIIAWLKIYQKPHEKNEEILRHLDFWLNIFKDNKYKIIIYNENIELPEHYYSQYQIINRSQIMENISCQFIQQQINSNNIIADRWKKAASALSFPYFYCKEKYVWNIDASDIMMDGPVNYYLDKIFDCLNKNNLPLLSSDIYLTTPNKSWSFGIHLSEREKMRQLIQAVLPIKVKNCGWGINLDHMLDCYFKSGAYPHKHIAFTTYDWIKHEGENGLWSRFNRKKNLGECNLYGNKKAYGKLNSRSLLIT